MLQSNLAPSISGLASEDHFKQFNQTFCQVIGTRKFARGTKLDDDAAVCLSLSYETVSRCVRVAVLSNEARLTCCFKHGLLGAFTRSPCFKPSVYRYVQMPRGLKTLLQAYSLLQEAMQEAQLLQRQPMLLVACSDIFAVRRRPIGQPQAAVKENVWKFRGWGV